MSLSPGVRLGAYEIPALVGAGGMGEIYRARDIRLDGTVAIKVLGAARASDPQLRDRFERDARDLVAQPSAHLHAVRRRTSGPFDRLRASGRLSGARISRIERCRDE